MPIIVDGYNLIFAGSVLDPKLDMERTEAARERILKLLAKYKASKDTQIVVVFDGGIRAAQLPRKQLLYGLEVVYSAANSTADAEIKRMVATLDNPRDTRVVSSDREIQRFAKRCGVGVVSSRDFLREVTDTLKHEDEIPPDEPIEKYEGLPPGEAEYWLNLFQEENEEE